MRDKVYITIKPKLNPATAVIGVRRVIFVATTSLGICVGLVFRPSALAVPHFGTFGDKTSGGTQTTTRLGIACGQTITQDIDNAPTVAFGIPVSISMGLTRVPQDGQAPELGAGPVDKTPVRWNRLKNNSIFSVVHSVFSYQKMVWIRLAKDSQGLWRAVFSLSNLKRICIGNMQEVFA